MVDRIGSLLTPLLLITILAMIVKGFIDFSDHSSSHGNTELFNSNIGSFLKDLHKVT